MPIDRPLAILLLCNHEPFFAQNIRDHMETLANRSRHRVRLLSSFGRLPASLDLDRFDAVLLHYSLFPCDNPDYLLPPATVAALGRYRGLKAAFLQDEYCSVNRTMATFRQLGIQLLFSCAPPASLDQLYPPAQLPGVRKVSILCGYVDAALSRRAVPPYAARPVDVGYRARELPPWLGALAQEKAGIAQRFGQACAPLGLQCDLSPRLQDRLYGEGWIDFLSRCKATLGVAGGASVIDFSGAIETRVRAHLAAHPDTPFAELQERYFADAEERVYYHLLSPRHFEAAALRTLQILYEDSYLGVLQPWRHYVPLRKDLANLAEVVAVLRDPARAQTIIDTAYQELACNPTFQWQALADLVDRELEARWSPDQAAPHPPYSDTHWRWQRANAWRLRLPHRLKDHLPPGLRRRLRQLVRF